MKLLWSRAGGRKEPVPASALRGLKGEYFQGNAFQQARRVRTDAQVDFAWGRTSPFGESQPQMNALELDLPPGRFRADWISPITGKTVKSETFQHSNGSRSLAAPAFPEDIALRINRR